MEIKNADSRFVFQIYFSLLQILKFDLWTENKIQPQSQHLVGKTKDIPTYIKTKERMIAIILLI